MVVTLNCKVPLHIAVIPKVGGAHRIGARKNYGNAQKLNYQLMKLSMYLLTLQNP
jgi:hypothetical protein